MVGCTSDVLASAPTFSIFRQKLQNEWKFTAYCGREYYCTNNMVEWMLHMDAEKPTTNAGLLLTEVYESLPSRPHRHESSQISHGERRCLIVFAILLELGYGHLIEAFQRYGIVDSKLPDRGKFDVHFPIKYFKNGGATESNQFWECFQERVWQYYPCALEFRMRATFLDSRYIMPFCKRQPINDKGGTAQVWEVAVQESLVPPKLAEAVKRSKYLDSNHGTCYVFAVKTFTEEHLEIFEWEREAYLVVQAKPQLPGMVRYLGEYEIDERLEDGRVSRTWNILLEYGEEDLEEFFASQRNCPPNLNPETIQFWKSLANVAEALDAIHNLELERENGHHDCFSGWHCDLKPDNILRVNGEFKLADFGFAKFKPTKLGDVQTKARITGGTETYGAPECDRARQDPSISVSQTIDTWSFGCVLSVSATWVVLGYQGVLTYYELRRIAIRKLREKRVYHSTIGVPVADDAFHNGVHVLPEVLEWHNYLRSVLRRSDTITGRILDLVEECMLQPESARKTNALHIAMEEQLQEAQYEHDRLMGGPGLDIVTDSVKEALLSVEDRAPSPVNSYQSEITTASDSSKISTYLSPTPSRRSRSKYSRINKSKKMDEAVQGRVAHRQNALKRDGRRSDSLTQPDLRLETDRTVEPSLVPGPLRLRPVDNSSSHNLIFTPNIDLGHPARRSTLSRSQGTFIEKEPVFPDTFTIPNTQSQRGNETQTPYRTSIESPMHQEHSLPPRIQSNNYLPIRPPSIGRQAPIPVSSESPQWYPQYQNTSWSIYEEHRALKSKGVMARIFKKDHDDYLKKFLVNRDIMFVVDNDTSMNQHWETMSVALETLALKVAAFDKDGLDIEFTVGNEHNARGVSSNKLLAKFEGAKRETANPRYRFDTDMTQTLTNIFDKYLHGAKRATTLIILTNGDWKGTVDPTSVERAIADFLKKPFFTQRLEKRWFTIQFVAFGHEVPRILQHLDDEIGKKYSIPDVVDTEHVSGDMYKMILGSFVGQYDISELTAISPTSPATPLRLDLPPTPISRRSSSRSPRSLSGIGGFFSKVR
ncbi:uncharacterized protein F4822DRAFT_305220 [Hypoxylon trugodes]|uniref:uncharacterized protein n=1 Tax=Hypoxylon trugodes TaxID=326681 RepID=UPI002190ABA7|nr:uncharacterized protein F4822DRAFT_305220 [Hypoxylon trugodes]KAI1386093.1 hypothetical protein F4822DRAFT_305220 [Hypoxylon trugodes]